MKKKFIKPCMNIKGFGHIRIATNSMPRLEGIKAENPGEIEDSQYKIRTIEFKSILDIKY
ncbi:MAG: hypothetical protein PUD92_02450 [Clostridiales bacterium]|nr:hypothetical protein [Clostridiales bacterium]